VDVLVFTNPRDPAKERFFQAISEVPSLSPKFILEHDGFIALLRNHGANWRAIVFFVYEPDDLTLAVLMKTYLGHSRLILVLPDWEEERVKAGLSLSPSLMTKANGNFSDVIAVLEKIATLVQ
jgi:hypothetical protein